MARYTIDNVDICNGSFFGGHHKPWFCILVDGTTTCNEVKEEMLDWQTTEHLEMDSWEDFVEAVDVLFNRVVDMNAPIVPTLDIHDRDDEDWDDEDSVRMFFTLAEEEEES